MNIDLTKIQQYLEWFKHKLYLNTISPSAKNRIIYIQQVQKNVHEWDINIYFKRGTTSEFSYFVHTYHSTVKVEGRDIILYLPLLLLLIYFF